MSQSEYRNGRRIDPEVEQRILELNRAGWSDERIAVQLGICSRTVLRARHRNGIRFEPKVLTAEELRRAEQMLDDGASYGELARTLGFTPAAFQRRFPGRSQWTRGGAGRQLAEWNARLASLGPRTVGVA